MSRIERAASDICARLERAMLFLLLGYGMVIRA
jgi:hypothetical protein